jgi:hypothetical protein
MSSKVPAVILLFVSVVELGMAVLFGVLSQSMPLVRTPFTVTAAILGVTGVGLLFWGVAWWKKAANTQRLKVEGIPGQARVLGVRQTGLYVNNQPQVELRLQVSTPVHGGYEATRKEIVPLVMIGRLSSGQPLPVKVDANDPQDLMIDWESAFQVPAGTL